VRVSPLSESLAILATSPETRIPDDLARDVDAAWNEIRRSNPLAEDGRIFSITALSSDRIEGRFVPYRWRAAQVARPDLARRLPVRPLAVSGLLLCSDGVVLGRRARHVGQPGLWELVPSGGISRGPPDWRDAIFTELSEEIGLHPRDVASVHPFCLIEDEKDAVVDIGIRIETPLTGAEIVGRHQALPVKEYAEIAASALGEAVAWLESRAPAVVPTSLALLRFHLSRDPSGTATR
jgi:hypothetical protein